MSEDPKTIVAQPEGEAPDTPTSEREQRSRQWVGIDALPTLATAQAREMTPTKRTIVVPPRAQTGIIDDQPDSTATVALPRPSRSDELTDTFLRERAIASEEPLDLDERTRMSPRPRSPSIMGYALVTTIGLTIGISGVWFSRNSANDVPFDPTLERAIQESMEMARATTATVALTSGRAILVMRWSQRPRPFKLFIDGNAVDSSARIFDLEAGEHVIEAVPLEGRPQLLPLRVEAGKTSRVVLWMRSATRSSSKTR